MKNILKWLGIIIGFLIVIVPLTLISPFLLIISIVAYWYFTKKKPNARFMQYAKNGMIASTAGLAFFIYSIVSSNEEIADVEYIDSVEQVASKEVKVEVETEEERSEREEAQKAEDERHRKEFAEYQKVKEARKKEREKERELAKEKERREKELTEANPNKTGESEAPIETVNVPDDKEEATVNDGIPFFSNEDITSTEVYHLNGPLDSLGRVTAANAVVGVEIMPAEQRGSIGHHEPTGWSQASYANIGSGGWLYNRSHLIGHQLTGNDDYANLMTGTRWFNMRMLEYENFVAHYVETTENLVRYRVTPVFEGNNLVASGAYMEGFSIEDNGDGLMFNIYIPNIQPGVEINYADGSSVGPEGPSQEGELPQLKPGGGSGGNSGSSSSSKPAPAPVPAPKPEPKPEPEPAPPATVTTAYVGNANTKKFHKSSCHHIKKMSDKNKVAISSREEAINANYDPCKVCKP